MVEQWTENPRVRSSILRLGTIHLVVGDVVAWQRIGQ